MWVNQKMVRVTGWNVGPALDEPHGFPPAPVPNHWLAGLKVSQVPVREGRHG